MSLFPIGDAVRNPLFLIAAVNWWIIYYSFEPDVKERRSPRMLDGGFTDLFPYRSFVRCVRALVFLRTSPLRHSSAEIRTPAVILSACRRESASSSSCCPAAHDQACLVLLASKWSSVVSLAFAKPFGLCGNLKWKEATVSFSFLQAAVWRLRPMIFYSLVSCFVE